MSKFKIIFFISLLFIHASLLQAEPYVDAELLERITKKYNLFAKKRFLYLQKTLDSVKDKSDIEKLEKVNSFFNKVKYAPDIKTYGKADYWATPWEFLGRDRGDCEDYAISKYFALLYLNVDAKKLFFTYVRSSEFKEAHMVLTYFETPRSEPLILDNNFKVLKASKRKDLTPVYHFNGESLYRAEAGKEVDNQKAHKKFDELKLNIKRKKI